MQSLKDQLPRIFQANLHRFYLRVVKSSFDALPEPVPLEFGEAGSLDVFPARAEAQVNNYTRNEAAKAFTLIISGLFERQLRQWAIYLLPQRPAVSIQNQDFDTLLGDCLQAAKVDGDIEGMRHDIVEANLVANVVRHGDGRSSALLKKAAPELWIYDKTEYADISAGPSPDSEQMRVRPDDVTRYTRASMLFWGWADPDQMAARGAPYF